MGSIRLRGDVPDVVCISVVSDEMFVVGELKVPWIPEHNLRAMMSKNKQFRRVLGKL